MNKLMILTLIAIFLLGPMKIAQEEGCKLFKLRAEVTDSFAIDRNNLIPKKQKINNSTRVRTIMKQGSRNEDSGLSF